MNKPYAVIQLAGKQHLVHEGDQLTVNRLDADKSLKVSDVLLVSTDKTTKVGEPTVKGAAVELEVIDHGKDKKIKVFKYKSKSRYRRTYGHRQPITTLKVTKITA